MKYLVITPHEDEPCIFLADDEKLWNLLDDPEGYGIERFLDHIPDKEVKHWDDGEALLLKIEKVLVPAVKATAFRLDW